jgi:hypothetical protein
MKIKIPNDTVTIASSDLKSFELNDGGGALVAIRFDIYQGDTQIKKMFNADARQWPYERTPDLQPGTYECYPTIAATRKKTSLGSTYKSSITLIQRDGTRTDVATARGSVPDGTPTDADSDVFKLVVT